MRIHIAGYKLWATVISSVVVAHRSSFGDAWGMPVGIILSIGRIVGETAVLIYSRYSAEPGFLLCDSIRTLALHLYVLSPKGLYIDKTYATAVVLLVVVLVINRLSNQFAKKFL